MDLFDRLADARVVRAAAAGEEEARAAVDDARLPITKRPEVMLSQGVVVSDELRALFFLGHNRHPQRGRGAGIGGGGGR
ncbi:hypothetical protein STCU_12142 [Strigomonas culicis]|uniref:Uncharacterized protein n=1 Tax=Strigomonas culicis TaxID=28005 RepID=S9UKU8_9TRYP|nr:hypothetical protein STCU_12142 [Strigomonas culicis]|eukprot:EPY15301.1 hypothetical protein STCU_12142 [Strigomonas culicis]